MLCCVSFVHWINIFLPFFLSLKPLICSKVVFMCFQKCSGKQILSCRLNSLQAVLFLLSLFSIPYNSSRLAKLTLIFEIIALKLDLAIVALIWRLDGLHLTLVSCRSHHRRTATVCPNKTVLVKKHVWNLFQTCFRQLLCACDALAYWSVFYRLHEWLL